MPPFFFTVTFLPLLRKRHANPPLDMHEPNMKDLSQGTRGIKQTPGGEAVAFIPGFITCSTGWNLPCPVAISARGTVRTSGSHSTDITQG